MKKQDSLVWAHQVLKTDHAELTSSVRGALQPEACNQAEILDIGHLEASAQ